jgi:hypothetical protein
VGVAHVKDAKTFARALSLLPCVALREAACMGRTEIFSHLD